MDPCQYVTVVGYKKKSDKHTDQYIQSRLNFLDIFPWKYIYVRTNSCVLGI